jgi:hypothetical protein
MNFKCATDTYPVLSILSFVSEEWQTENEDSLIIQDIEDDLLM